jgi:hypothetical protein
VNDRNCFCHSFPTDVITADPNSTENLKGIVWLRMLYLAKTALQGLTATDNITHSQLPAATKGEILKFMLLQKAYTAHTNNVATLTAVPCYSHA